MASREHGLERLLIALGSVLRGPQGDGATPQPNSSQFHIDWHVR